VSLWVRRTFLFMKMTHGLLTLKQQAHGRMEESSVKGWDYVMAVVIRSWIADKCLVQGEWGVLCWPQGVIGRCPRRGLMWHFRYIWMLWFCKPSIFTRALKIRKQEKSLKQGLTRREQVSKSWLARWRPIWEAVIKKSLPERFCRIGALFLSTWF
jgi:hypothetical protein